jgi:hypothetical protein
MRLHLLNHPLRNKSSVDHVFRRRDRCEEAEDGEKGQDRSRSRWPSDLGDLSDMRIVNTII